MSRAKQEPSNMKTIQKLKRAAVKTLGVIGLTAGLMLASVGETSAQNVQYLLNNGVIPIGLSNVVTFTAVEGQEVSIQYDIKLTGAGTAGVCTVIEASNNNTNWSTTPYQFFRAANGATMVSHLTNFDVGPYTFLRATIHNTNSVAVTNSTITALVKKDYR